MILLNLGVVRERLSIKPEIVCGELFHEMQFQNVRPMPGTECCAFNDTTLYLTEWQLLSGRSSVPRFLICIGGGEAAEAFFTVHGISGLIYGAETDSIRLFSEVLDIFDYFQNLHTEYRSMLISQHPMHSIINAAAAFFDCFSVLFDANGKTLEYCTNFLPNPRADEEEGAAEAERLAEKIAAAVRSRQTESPTTAAQPQIDYFPPKGDVPPFFLARFTDGNRFLAMFAVCAAPQPFRSDTETLLRYVANLMSPCIVGRMNPSVKIYSHIRAAISAIVDKDNFNYSSLSDSLSKIGWRLNDTYQLVYIRIQIGSARNLYTVTDYHRYESLFPDCIAVKERLYVVVVVHNSSESVIERAMENLRQLMRDFRMECMISLPFRDFMQLRDHFELIRSAMNLREADETITMYQSVMGKHIVSEMSRSIPIRALCHPSAVQICEYDRQNGTELLLSLEKYLYHNQSLQEAAEEMYIHRNTLNYRLKTCMKIAELPLEAPFERLHLLFSCIVLRCLAIEQKQPDRQREK